MFLDWRKVELAALFVLIFKYVFAAVKVAGASSKVPGERMPEDYRGKKVPAGPSATRDDAASPAAVTVKVEGDGGSGGDGGDGSAYAPQSPVSAASAAASKNLERWSRVMQNDKENLPIDVVLLAFCDVVTSQNFLAAGIFHPDEALYYSGIQAIAVVFYVVGRILHTVAFSCGCHPFLRTSTFFIGKASVVTALSSCLAHTTNRIILPSVGGKAFSFIPPGALQAVLSLSLVLYLFYFAVTLIGAAKKLGAGDRAPEDVNNGLFKKAKSAVLDKKDGSSATPDGQAAAAAASDRWKRIVANFNENLPIDVLIFLTTAAVGATGLIVDGGLDNTIELSSFMNAQIGLFSIYVASRILFTIAYGCALPRLRGLGFGLGVLVSIATAFMGLVFAGKRPSGLAGSGHLNPAVKALFTYLLLLLVLKIKVVVAAYQQGAAKFKAGDRTAEDLRGKTFDNSGASQVKAHRWTRIVNNDTENIAFDLGVFWFTQTSVFLYAGALNVGKHQTYSSLFVSLLVLYTVFRISHTVFYACALSKPRSICWGLSKLMLLTSVVVAFVSGFDIQ